MKFGLTLKDIQLGEVKVGEVSVSTEFSINEMVAMRKEVEHVLENAPTYIEQLGDAVATFLHVEKVVNDFEEEIDRASEEQQMVKAFEQKLKATVMNKILGK